MRCVAKIGVIKITIRDARRGDSAESLVRSGLRSPAGMAKSSL
jgi:hypothetical protein